VEDQEQGRFDGGLTKLLGFRFEEASGDRVVVVCPVTPDLHQPYGLVHGGVYATLAETAASLGGALWLGDRGRTFGITNQTDFLRPVRDGELRAVATPLSRGRTTQLWQVTINDQRDRLVAHGRVRLINLSETPGSDS
jgi:1,4-dihydroxy-2-naphthoyl-CoA hydrolase